MMSVFKLAKLECFRQQFKDNKGEKDECANLPNYPVPGSNLILELNRKGTEYYIKTMVNGVAYKICGSEVYCKYSVFKEMLLKSVQVTGGLY